MQPEPIMLAVRCAVCSKCWVQAGTYTCIYNGPYHGYVEVKGNQAKPDK